MENKINYDAMFSCDVASFMRSPVREIFSKVDLNAIYSFAGGYPDAATFPANQIRETTGHVIEKYGAQVFQYGATQGEPVLRRAVAKRYGVDMQRVLITSSSQQGIDVCTRVLVDPGDTILTSAPTYLGALQSFRSYRARVSSVAHASNVAELKAAYEKAIEQSRVAGSKVKFLYMIPDFQNPSGETLTLAEREMLVALAQKHDFLIVEDSPYRELRYEGEQVATMYSLCPDRVIYLGSFSKTFAPGFRVGWMMANEKILDKIYACKQALDLCAPKLSQFLIAEFIESGSLDANLKKTIALYRTKRDLMLNLLEKYMPENVTWTRPEGGLFLFVTLPQGCDTVALYEEALSAGVAYVAGSFFTPNDTLRNTMRLNFSFLDACRMEAGVKLLSDLLRKAIKIK